MLQHKPAVIPPFAASGPLRLFFDATALLTQKYFYESIHHYPLPDALLIQFFKASIKHIFFNSPSRFVSVIERRFRQ